MSISPTSCVNWMNYVRSNLILVWQYTLIFHVIWDIGQPVCALFHLDKHYFWIINVYWFFAGNRCLLTLIWVSRVLNRSSNRGEKPVYLARLVCSAGSVHYYTSNMIFEGFVFFLFHFLLILTSQSEYFITLLRILMNGRQGTFGQ